MDRYWFLTNTCYGTWLPGDTRGFVGRVRDERPDDPDTESRLVHNLFDDDYDKAVSGLVESARELMLGPPVHLTSHQAEAALEQFQETARIRGWQLLAASVMFNHFHLVVGVNGDPEPGKMLGEFKAWATRRLTRQFGEPVSKTWWTSGGSKR